jgi:hypothetical protein
MPDNSLMDPQGYSDNSRLRASDADRDRAATVINSAMAEGRLTPDEHSERLDAIYAAKTHADIVPILDDLPAHAGAAVSPRAEVSGPAQHTDRVLALLSGASRKGTWQPSPVMDVVLVMGGAELDFRDAVLTGGEVHVRAVCVMGGMQITVPPEMRVVDSAVMIMGGSQTVGNTPESMQPGAPVLRLSGVCIMGGFEVNRKDRTTGKNRRGQITG